MAHVKLILLEDVENLGLAGTEVSVAPGYARNFLMPRGLAAKATPAILRLLAARKDKIEARRSEELAAAKALAEKIAAFEVTILAQASNEDQLFGSITARNISDKLIEAGFNVGHQRIRIEHPIKALGNFTVEAKLHPEVTVDVKVSVVRA